MEETEVKQEQEQEVTQEMILEQWRTLAEKNCKHCYGTGVEGWKVDGKERTPTPCHGKRCVVQKYMYIKIMQKREELKKQKEVEDAARSSEQTG